MPGPFKGVIELDIRDSTPDWDAVLPDKAPFEFTGGTIVRVVVRRRGRRATSSACSAPRWHDD